MNLKKALASFYFIIGMFLFSAFDLSFWVWISFLVNFLIVGGILLYHLFAEKEFSPFLSSYIVFSFLFFTVSPIIQISSFSDFTQKFKTLLPYESNMAVIINLYILLFHLVFFGSYLFFKKYLTSAPKPSNKSNKYLPIQIVFLTLLSLGILVANLNFIVEELSRPNWQEISRSVSDLIFRKKVLFIVPLGGIALIAYYLKFKSKKYNNVVIVLCCLVLLFICLLFFKNPLIEKRNALGPIFFALLFLFIPFLVNTNTRLTSLLFAALIIAFPLVSIVTHTDANLGQILKNPSVVLKEVKGGGPLSSFTTLNYDAFSNIGATIDYVEDHGHTYGHQIVSTAFFFIPRSIWESKATPTGQLVGDHLIEKHGFKYNNLSNPLVSEGYIDFGIVGIVLMAIVLALVCVLLLKWIKSDDILYKVTAFYFAIHLIFLLRGDLTNGYAYFMGTCFGLLIIPKLTNTFIEALFTSKTIKAKNEV